MNNPDSLPIDVEEQRAWLMDHKQVTGASWPTLAAQIGVPSGTISQFGTGKYQGDNEKIGREIFRYRQHLATQAEIAVEAPAIPGFYETPTARRIITVLSWAQRGRLTVVATGPGTGKTSAVEHYRDSVTNVWVVTMAPSTAGVNNMQIEVLAALGEKDAVGTPQKLSRRIRDRVKNTGGLIVFDEAQHLSEKAIEEIRSWHDATGIGIALLGNEHVIARLEGGARRAAYAQLYSRVGMRHVQNLPLDGDARALAEAWNVTEPREIAYVVAQAMKPGGLRGVTMMMELATMIAAAERQPRGLSHLQDAWAQLASRPIAA